ncbi:sensor histidine kinase [Paenibacillus sp. P96]|uniref:Sensor histidine kinase n=1 Tax=Paenibacillus zeirhizosphaerae TaxID=2987519 RepID=A0ABT9FTF7_9BACL|nr:sensor histidine kinase [Paenibacillus sp. P96]MDP4098028.1 sensor histidine kinase [Paenibacillus sp. P96]
MGAAFVGRVPSIINNIRMRNKLLFSYVVIVMIPVLLVGGAVIVYLREQALQSAIAQTVNNVEKIKAQTGNLLRVPTDISNLLMFDSKLNAVVNRRYDGMLDLTKAYHEFDDFKEYREQYREIESLRFYSFNPTLVNNLEFIPVDADTQNALWFKEALTGTEIHWYYIRNEAGPMPNLLSLVRQVPFPEHRTSGVLVMGINQGELNAMLSKEPFNTMIADEQGIVVAAKDPDMVGRTLQELELGFDVHNRGKGTYKAEVNGESANIIVDELLPESSISGLTVISIFSTADIVSGANRISLIGFVCILMVLVTALILVTMISLLITKRLQRLSEDLNAVARGDLNVVTRVDGGDEIGDLSRQFNRMVESINELMRQVYDTSEKNSRLELAQKDIKLKMMASQINPHFLFNALESIRMKAHIRGETEIARVVRLLGKLMRKNIEIGGGYTTLQEELVMVRSYLEIQKFRYGERLQYEVAVDEAALMARIPPLIIQPLVENAVVHGLENKEEPVSVKVTVSLHDGSLHTEVEDNGNGMEAARLEQVKASFKGEEGAEVGRIGMRNVHQRLTLMYGEHHGIRMDSKVGEGTKVRFTLPVEEETHCIM